MAGVGTAAVAQTSVNAAEPSKNATAPKVVTIDSSNSSDITSTANGERELAAFGQRMKKSGINLDTQESKTLAARYRVVATDTAKLFPDPDCRAKRGPETLVLPTAATNVRYMEGSPDPKEATPCLTTVLWDEVEADIADDQAGNTTAAAATLEEYGHYCASRTYFGGWWHMPCHVKYVLKNDGNPDWNYYAIEAWNSCQSNDSWTAVKSCGRGQEPNASDTTYWRDYAPQAASDSNCRSISLSVQVGYIGLGGSYTHCEEQRVYLYDLGGKMSTYWKGTAKEGVLRTTRHRSSVRVPQAQGRPDWSNWFNSDACTGLIC